MKQWDCLNLKQELNKLLDAFKISEAKRLLISIPPSDIPKDLRFEFAQIARRLGMNKFAVKVLWPNIYEEKRPLDRDVLEFASTIRGLGLVNQSLKLLGQLPEQPLKSLYKAYGYISRWEYETAISHLQKYLNYPNLSEKQIVLAKLNLASAYVSTLKFDLALNSINEIEDICRSSYVHLYLNCQELKGQIYLHIKDFAKAHEVLNYAKEKSQSETGNTSLFIRKWHLLADCYEGKCAIDGDQVVEFKNTIRQAKHWETLRDFDLNLAFAFKNYSLLNQVYFGTPYGDYKEKIKLMSNHPMPNQLLVLDKRNKDQLVKNFDPRFFSSVALPEGKLLHRLMMLLLSDFYRPWSVGRIFDSLCPDQIYDPFSSPKKIYRLVEKLKSALELEKIPLHLKSTKQGYRLRPGYESCVVISDKMIFSTREEYFLNKLKTVGNVFSRLDLQEVLNLTDAQAQSLIKTWIDKKELTTLGVGKSIKYKLA